MLYNFEFSLKASELKTISNQHSLQRMNASSLNKQIEIKNQIKFCFTENNLLFSLEIIYQSAAIIALLNFGGIKVKLFLFSFKCNLKEILTLQRNDLPY